MTITIVDTVNELQVFDKTRRGINYLGGYNHIGIIDEISKMNNFILPIDNN
ncbi:MAG: hypothetical protein Q4Q22_02850 [Methanosphaera sp.]|nr:hypothetical protein [Methanosphaera sp.]